MANWVEKYKKYGPNPTTHDLWKYIALLTMFIDHIGIYFFDNHELMWRAVGRWSFPIWGFLAGYARPGKTGKDIILLAILLVIADAIVYQPILPLNILVSILLSRLYIQYLEQKKYSGDKIYVEFLVLLVWFPISMVLFEYGTIAMMLALCGYMQRNYADSRNTTIAFVLTTIIYLFFHYIGEPYNIVQALVMTVGVVAVMIGLKHYKLREFPIKRFVWLHHTGMFLARNSLYVYFAHVALFVMIHKLLYPMTYTHFIWFKL